MSEIADGIALDLDDEIATVWLSQPQRLNALDGAMVGRLLAILEDFGRSGGVKLLLIRGRGRAFCAGVDLKFVHENDFMNDSGAHLAFQNELQRLGRTLESAPFPVVGVAHGYALAGGLELLLACDFVLVSEEAVLGDEHMRRNLLPGGGASQRLPRRVGRMRGLFMLMTGERISGKAAVELGLALEAAPDAELDAAVARFVERFRDKDPTALRYLKESVRRGLEMPLGDGLVLEQWMSHNYTALSSTAADSVARFAEKS